MRIPRAHIGGLLALVFAVSAVFPSQVQAVGENLIANPSVEIINTPSAQPKDWGQNSWGNLNATFTYVSGGAHNGSRSLSVRVTNYVEGDAKWYFTPVAVTPSTSYIYYDYSISTVPNQIVVAQYDSTGNASYTEVTQLTSNNKWRKNVIGFQTAANTVSVSVFHILRANGLLKTDSFNLHTAETPIITDNIPNNSHEQVSEVGIKPLAWNQGSWGVNTPKYSYLATGRTGTKSVKVEITNFSSGDAKWYYNPQPITPGQRYRFKDYYKSDGPTSVLAAITKADQSVQYLYLGEGVATTTWRLFSSAFDAPADAVSVTILHVLARNGYLITDDYSLKETSATFDTGRVSIAFDDGRKSAYTTAFPLLESKGFKSTQYLVSGFINTSAHFTSSEVLAFSAAGHEIGSHTVTHRDLTTLTDSQVQRELQDSKTYFESLLQKPVTSFALPYGAYNSSVLAKTVTLYMSTRSSDSGFNTIDNLNAHNLRIQSVEVTTTPAQVAEWVESARVNRTWLILLYHDVDETGSQYSTSVDSFTQHLNHIHASGIAVQTVSTALVELLSQL